MREKRNFAERTSTLSSDEARKKCFLVYEGKDTELLYFDAVNSLKGEININPIIELVPIVRSYSEDGWSNPKKIVDRITRDIQECRDCKYSYETMLNRIMDYLQEEGYILNNRTLARNVWKVLNWICVEKLKVKLSDIVQEQDVAYNQMIYYMREELQFENLVNDIGKIVSYGGFTYEEGFDTICFVVDRDKESFTEEQYDTVVAHCEEKGYELFLTNPCFEFWLLMHFQDVTDLDREQLLQNPWVSSKRRYTEKELRNRMPGFTKSKYNALAMVKNINVAIENEHYFCENINDLKTQIGSNVGILVKKLRM